MTYEPPPPPCQLGLTYEEIERHIGRENLDDFFHWFRGKTGAICDGQRFNPKTQKMEHSGCGPHGMVYYTHDVVRYKKKKGLI